MAAKWKTYEDVARHLLAKFKEQFGLEDVEGKQKIKGMRSGTDWEIDAKGCKTGEKEMFVIMEFRSGVSSGQKQGDLGALCWSIIDTGASGGIIVSPRPLQEGGRKVAKAGDIVEVTLNENSSTTDYVMQFLNKVMVGVGLSLNQMIPSISVRVTVTGPRDNAKPDDRHE